MLRPLLFPKSRAPLIITKQHTPILEIALKISYIGHTLESAPAYFQPFVET